MPRNPGARWREVIATEYDVRHPDKRTSRRSVGINMDEDQYDAVANAAAARGMTMAAFVRRAALAVAVYDDNVTGGELSWEELNAHEQRIREGSLTGADPVAAQGFDFGNWIIEGMQEYVRPAT